jgi:hypothetical protein
MVSYLMHLEVAQFLSSSFPHHKLYQQTKRTSH